MSSQRIELVIRQLVVAGALLVLLVPAARGSSEWFGWLPLWFVGMPLAAWWSLRRCPLPHVALQLPRRRRAQALRRGDVRRAHRLPRAA